MQKNYFLNTTFPNNGDGGGSNVIFHNALNMRVKYITFFAISRCWDTLNQTINTQVKIGIRLFCSCPGLLEVNIARQFQKKNKKLNF